MVAVSRKTGHSFWQWIYVFIASMGFLLYGLEAAWISPTTKKLQAEDSPLGAPVSNQMIASLASISTFSSAFVVPIYSLLTDKYGRKWVVFCTVVPAILSLILRLAVPNIIALCISRALAGIAASGTFAVVPMYIRELSQDNLVGVLTSVSIIMQNMGFLIMYLIGAYLDYFAVLWVYFGFAVAMGVMIVVAPESPAFLVNRGEIDDAYKALAHLRGLTIEDKKIITEIELMQKQTETFRNLPKVSLKDILKDKSWRKGFLFMLSIFTIHAWNGAFSLLTYASAILEATGGGLNISPELQTISFPIIMIIASLTLSNIADRWGRKPLHALCYGLSAFSLTGLGIALLLKTANYVIPKWLPISCMVVAVAAYAGGVRPLPYIFTNDIFNFQVRAKVMGCLVTYGWLTVSTQLFAYGPMTDTFGLHTVFIFFGGVNILGFIVALMIPETRNKSEEQIRDELANRKKTDV